MSAPTLTVVGSLVLDLVVWLEHLPRRGETAFPRRFETFAGGKGFNQAITARRCGAAVQLVGRVGADAFGQIFETVLAAEGLPTASVTHDPDAGTSLGIPMIDAHGDNSILVIQRANLRLTPADVEAAAPALAASQALLLQLEVPLAASRHAAALASAHGATVLLNPAPAHLPLDELLPAGDAWVDWLIPNESEAAALTGQPVTDFASAHAAAACLLARGVRQGVIITLGAQGALALTHTGAWRQPAFPVTVVDPTGAGDAFCGAFGVALAEGQPLDRALRFASAAGALAVTVAGAEPSLPRRAAIETLLSTHDPLP
ncbi:MAG: ribokinase [Anaerolineales bacterium]|nr:ribokinase [Anaerolineales bacterium]